MYDGISTCNQSRIKLATIRRKCIFNERLYILPRFNTNILLHPTPTILKLDLISSNYSKDLNILLDLHNKTPMNKRNCLKMGRDRYECDARSVKNEWAAVTGIFEISRWNYDTFAHMLCVLFAPNRIQTYRVVWFVIDNPITNKCSNVFSSLIILIFFYGKDKIIRIFQLINLLFSLWDSDVATKTRQKIPGVADDAIGTKFEFWN